MNSLLHPLNEGYAPFEFVPIWKHIMKTSPLAALMLILATPTLAADGLSECLMAKLKPAVSIVAIEPWGEDGDHLVNLAVTITNGLDFPISGAFMTLKLEGDRPVPLADSYTGFRSRERC